MYDKNPPENGGFVSNLKSVKINRLLFFEKIYNFFKKGVTK